MLPSTRAFLSGVIDYAGMFPPAKLPLQEALANFMHYRTTSPHAWMLGRFVCPAARLGELTSALRATDNPPLIRIVALGKQSASMDDVLPQLDADLAAIKDFDETWRGIRGGAAIVDRLELTLPKDADTAQFGNLAPALEARLPDTIPRGYLEVPFGPSWRSDVANVCRVLNGDPRGLFDMKLRCGGTDRDAFPSIEDVACFMVSCRESIVGWKATAGLHHARPFWDESLKVWQHGFLNVFAAGILLRKHNLGVEDIAAILSDRECTYLRFADDEFAWKNWVCPLDKITRARRYAVKTFGSCSFIEPCAELVALGLIDG